ncbi:MAG: hypothetical protein KF802_10680 [Bdellovibrionaceae bacterium]|nr:hypothetical protein [Pseudobdellovibrionaceae bacterium]
MTLFRKTLFTILLISGLGVPPAGAQENHEEERKSLERELIESNILISQWFDGVADGLDLFLVGQRITKKRNETSIKIENTSYYIEGEGPSNSTSLSANLRLPNLEQYWMLKFSDYDENRQKGVRETYLRQSPRPKNYGATVGLFQKLGNVRVAFEPRIGLQDPLSVSHSLSFESVADLVTYKVNPKIELYATSDKGTGVYQALNINFQLSRIHSLTFVNDGDYEDRVHRLSVNNGVALGQVVEERKKSLSYSLIFSSNNRPNYNLSSYRFSVSWDHLLYQKILDYAVTPYVDFARARGFKGQSGINFTVGLNF